MLFTIFLSFFFCSFQCICGDETSCIEVVIFYDRQIFLNIAGRILYISRQLYSETTTFSFNTFNCDYSSMGLYYIFCVGQADSSSDIISETSIICLVKPDEYIF